MKPLNKKSIVDKSKKDKKESISVIVTNKKNMQSSPSVEIFNSFSQGQVLGCIVPFEEMTSNSYDSNEKYRRVVIYNILNGSDYFLAFYITTQGKEDDYYTVKKPIEIKDDLFTDNLQDSFKNFTEEYKKIDNIGKLTRHKYFFSQLIDDGSFY